VVSQRFSVSFRESLWETYSEQCFYCRHAILFVELEIDHLVPATIGLQAGDALVRRLCLDSSFGIHGYQNLVPSCRQCNQLKGDKLLPDAQLIVLFARIKDKIPKLETALARRRSERDLDQLCREIMRSLEAGKFSLSELEKRVEIFRRFPNGISGSKGPTLPQSPEVVVHGLRAEVAPNIRVGITARAAREMEKAELTLTTLEALAYSALTSSNARLRQVVVDGASNYELRGPNSLRLYFTHRDDTILILSAHVKREQTAF
jgi:hypothetical protein